MAENSKMQAANAMEIQRKIVVRTKSGSFTKIKPGASGLRVSVADRFAASQIRTMVPDRH
jgi:hypothetical protein